MKTCRLVFAALLVIASSANAGRLTTFAWEPGANWPEGTTVELCGNGDVCATGITATQHTLDLPVNPGEVIHGQARAYKQGYQCDADGDPETPDVLCEYSDWATVEATWPTLPVNFYVTREESDMAWSNQDIGSVGLAGSYSYDDGTFTIEGAGADIWGADDSFHYVYKPLAGDGTIVARVASVEYTSGWAKAGVMIRDSLDANSRHAMIVVTPANGVGFQSRPATGGSSYHTAGAAVLAPYWVKLVRAGNTFTAYQSADGLTWTLVGSDTISMATSVYIGLVVTSHDNGALCTTTIDNVSLPSLFLPTKSASQNAILMR
jgi:regulation of enolase protein 1 (concanavalin A-like superfamily)